jgi:hypothetical protein
MEDQQPLENLSGFEQAISILIPIIGFGIYLTTMNSNPRKSKTALQCGLFGMVLGIVLYVMVVTG